MVYLDCTVPQDVGSLKLIHVVIQKFHADRYYAEILAMFVKENAAFGGEQYLASFPTIYNKMMEEDPDSLKLLAQEWSWPKDSM